MHASELGPNVVHEPRCACRALVPSLPARRGPSSERASQRGVWCQSQRSEGGPGPQSAKASREACKETYPSEQLDLTPEDGLFPRCAKQCGLAMSS
jgi:hypothetical protein